MDGLLARSLIHSFNQSTPFDQHKREVSGASMGFRDRDVVQVLEYFEIPATLEIADWLLDLIK